MPLLGAMASRLIGAPQIRLVHDQVLIKPGQGDDTNVNPVGNVGWHQDAAHWNVFNTNTFVTAWIALQDTDEGNGCVRFVRRSKKWGLEPGAHTFAVKDLDELAWRQTKVKSFAAGRWIPS